MSKPSTINKLPLDVRNELKKRLRSYDGDYLLLTAWLNEQSYGISKSSLGRYAKKLREDDEKKGMDREVIANQDTDIVALFEELDRLKTREAEIIALLKASTVFHKPCV